MNFYFIYKRLAHPGVNGYMDAYSAEDRLAHIQEAKQTLHTQIPWIADNLSDEMFNALGQSFNAEFLVDPEGRIVRMRDWSNPSQLRRDLQQLVGPGSPGPVAAPAASQPASAKFPRGVMPPVSRPVGLNRVRTRPQPSRQPFYAKLAAQAQPRLLRTGDGVISFTFMLDPVHHVHWNNRAPALHWTLRDPRSGQVLATGDAPTAPVDADVDPRHVVAELHGVDPSLPLQLDVQYIASDDANTWSKLVNQSYLVGLNGSRP